MCPSPICTITPQQRSTGDRGARADSDVTGSIVETEGVVLDPPHAQSRHSHMSPIDSGYDIGIPLHLLNFFRVYFTLCSHQQCTVVLVERDTSVPSVGKLSSILFCQVSSLSQS